jgi:hypothetical protein
MRRIRQVLQLHFGARASARVIGGTVGIRRSTVQDYLTRAAAAGLVWPLPPEQTDEALEQLLFPNPRSKPGARRYVEPDWPVLVREMKRPGVNLSVLFEEYRAVYPDGYAYSRYVTAKIMLRSGLSLTGDWVDWQVLTQHNSAPGLVDFFPLEVCYESGPLFRSGHRSRT